jgi:putative phosphoribosyl transferase
LEPIFPERAPIRVFLLHIPGTFAYKAASAAGDSAVGEIVTGETVKRPRAAFADRLEAGARLAEFMGAEPDPKAIVFALPRGGVPVGNALAEALGAPLEPILVRKLPIPFSPEAGFGAVAIDGSVVLNEGLVADLGISGETIDAVVEEVLREVRRRAGEYGAAKELPEARDRNVYIVDDGLASGYTMIAAAQAVRRKGPRSMTAAVPVSPRDSLTAVAPYFDRVYCMIEQERPPFAVASFYEDFHDLSDEEVKEILMRRREALGRR